MTAQEQLPRPLALLLDLDNTLYAYDPCHQAALEAVAEVGVAQGIAGSSVEFIDVYAQARADVKSQLGDVAASHHRLFYFQRLVERSFKRVSPPLVLKLYQLYWDIFIKRMRLDPGVTEALRFAKERNVGIAVISDMTADIQHRKLIQLGIDEWIDSVVTSEEVGVEKPNPSLVRAACDRLDVGKGKQIWLIGDSPERDLRMANGAGLTALWRRRGTRSLPPDVRVDATITDFHEVERLLRASLK